MLDQSFVDREFLSLRGGSLEISIQSLTDILQGNSICEKLRKKKTTIQQK